jgi:serine/threonine protein kinase/sulfur carrier protein ThiS
VTTEDPKGSGLDATVSAPGAAGSGSPAASASARTSGSTDTPLAPGATLGRYVLVEALGAGGMGMVFRARDPDLGREVAVKVLRASDGGSGGSLERRLLREAQAMATISHDNLANVYDIGTAGGRVFIAMELLDGGTLRALIADPQKTWRDKLAAVVAAGRGLAAAHSAGVIHRDFKPDNVLVARNGRVKVVDFGLARADRTAPDATDTKDGRSPSGEHALPPDLSAHLTQTGALLGTPAYMAPEQHAGELVDARSDQFAFAVTAWEAVYGQRPFVSDAYSSLVSAVRTHTITPPPKHAGVPAALEAVLRRALSPAADDRFASIDAAIDAIERATRRDNSRVTMIAIGASALFIGGAVIAVIATRSSSTTTPNRRTKPAVANKLGGDINVKIDPFDMANVGEFAGGGPGKKDVAVERLGVVGELQHHTDEITDCFGTAGIDHTGSVSIQFTIGANGRVISYRATQDDFADTELGGCIGSKAMRWTFPAPQGGQPITVTFPFRFTTGKDDANAIPGFPDMSSFQGSDWVFDHAGGGDTLEERIDSGLDEIDDNHYSLPRSVAAEIVATDHLASAARYVPFSAKGKKVGYKVYAIREDSLLDQLGIHDGDLVTALDGIALTSAAAADHAVAAATSADRIEVELTRDGADAPIALSIDIIPDGSETEAGGPVPPVPPAPPAPAP